MQAKSGIEPASIGKFLIFLALGLGSLGYFYFTKQQARFDGSDAANLKSIRLGMDSWIGYFPACGFQMKKRLRNRGFNLECVDGPVSERIKELSYGKLDLAFSTVDSYVNLGAAYDYPAVFIMVVDESKGGDAIVGYEINDLSQIENKTIAYAPESPSEHLLRGVAYHFDLKFSQSIPVSDSNEALDKLKNRLAEVAVLWEPDVTKALQIKGINKLISSKDTERLIVDGLLIHRSRLSETYAKIFIEEYFGTLKYYRENLGELKSEIEASFGLKPAEIDSMLSGVEYSSLADNAIKWFATNFGEEDGLSRTINGSIKILENQSTFRSKISSPLVIQSSNLIAELYDGKGSRNQEIIFSHLEPEVWKLLKPVGRLKLEPITFPSGQSDLSLQAKEEIDKVAEKILFYPNFRILIEGHTGMKGDKQANIELSQARAESVVRYLNVTYGMTPNRMLAIGYGSDKPLPRLPNESLRAYNYRLPRVEVHLLKDDL